MSLSDRCEELERELADTRAIIDKEAQDYAQTYLDNQVLAAQVLQMRESIGAIATYSHKPDDVKRWADEALALDTKPAEQIVNAVKAQALREAAKACGIGNLCACEFMADELAPRCRKCGGTMLPGKAIQQMLTGVPDFPGDTRAMTLHPSGGKLIDCMKCEKCGWSVTG